MDQYMKHHPHQYHHLSKSTSQKLENIEEEDNIQVECIETEERNEDCCQISQMPILSVPPPETPTETMEFLARSWSLSAVEISRVLTLLEKRDNIVEKGTEKNCLLENDNANYEEMPKLAVKIPILNDANMVSPPISPRSNPDIKPLRSARTRTMGGWIKQQKEKKRAEARSQNAQAYAATSVAGVAAAVAAIVAETVFAHERSESNCNSKMAAAVASASALVASHCVEMAQQMGASQEQILTAIQSAVNAHTSGDIMALTAGAATALRAAAMLRARLHREFQAGTLSGEIKETKSCASPLSFVSQGGELLKRTRKGILHWKQVSVYVNSNCQVIVKMKSTHMAGTFIKTKKSLVIDVCSEIAAWPGRELEEGLNQRAYFGIKTPERRIEFECRNQHDKKLWIQGIKEMLNRSDNINTTIVV
ncbi:hypothetical protein LUZ61_004713 [Rhynchospora tenuis]|uniref:PH domain-containing protein n=1 Tax=Rhynchospora tenuis TaxID=198213 RepID=A0AAD6ETX9_9POAL|nr:hypothetical protein LUZ61_004713 [Rhynchospora tenuis]